MSINQANRALLVCLVLGLMLSLPQHRTAAQGGDDKTGKKTDDDKADKKKEELPKHKEQYAQEYEHSFKNDKELNPLFHWHGEDAQGCMEFDPTGHLLHLQDGHPGKRMGTGVGINT